MPIDAPEPHPDDGTANEHLRTALVDAGPSALLAAPGARLLLAVIPDLDIPHAEPAQMAAATMINASGLRGLLGFSGLDSLTAWRSDARPMPMAAYDAARLAVANGCAALVIDVLGPHRVAVTGRDLDTLAASTVTVDRRGCP